MECWGMVKKELHILPQQTHNATGGWFLYDSEKMDWTEVENAQPNKVAYAQYTWIGSHTKYRLLPANGPKLELWPMILKITTILPIRLIVFLPLL